MENVFDKLKNHNYSINQNNKIIHSDITLGELLHNQHSVSKSDDMIELGEYYKYSDFECSENIFISYKLLTILTTQNIINEIRYIFSIYDYPFHYSLYNKIFDFIKDKYNYLTIDSDGYLKYGINGDRKIRFGKFINKILYFYKYRRNLNKIVEELVNYYKFNVDITICKVALLNGDDIKHGYDMDYHHRIQNSVLFNSCMNNRPSEFFELYSKNKNKIYLLVLLNDGKIISRNLMWYIKKYNNVLLDKIYHTNDSIRTAIINLAEHEKWIISDCGFAKNICKIDKGNCIQINDKKYLDIKLNFKGIKKFPYLDTFRYQSIFSNKLTNKYRYNFSYHYDNTLGERYKNYF